MTPNTDYGCAGKTGTWDCKYRPIYVVAGDSVCAYHLASMVKLRLHEIGKPITVSLIDGSGA